MLEVRKKRAFEAGFILYGLVVFLLAFISNTSIVLWFFATLPILLGIITLVLLIESDFINMSIVTIIPIVFSIFFYFIWKSNAFVMISKMDGPVIAIIDLFALYIIYVIIFFIWGNKNLKKKVIVHKIKGKQTQQPQQQVQQAVQVQDDSHYKNAINGFAKQLELTNNEKEYYKNIAQKYYDYFERSKAGKDRFHELSANYAEQIRKYISGLVDQIKDIGDEARKDKVNPAEFKKKKQYYTQRINELNKRLHEAEQALLITHENFTINLRSIEDKCKAINFVIGRVYSDKHGANKKIREMLNINRVLYNAFSEITSDFDVGHVVHLMLVLKLLKKKLALYHIEENKLFTLRKNPKLPLKRNPEGKDIILDVLVNNDKDPIKEYHAEASEICNKMVEYLEDNYELKG